MTQGLPRKLRFAFLMQVAMASIVILAGTWVAMTVAKEQIARYALQEEADYFWSRRALDPAREPPDESRLRGYALAAGDSAAGLPPALRQLEPGVHLLPDLLVLVEQRGEAGIPGVVGFGMRRFGHSRASPTRPRGRERRHAAPPSAASPSR